MIDVAEQGKWLRETTHGLLKRIVKWRRLVEIGLVIAGALIIGVGGVAANLVGATIKWHFTASKFLAC